MMKKKPPKIKTIDMCRCKKSSIVGVNKSIGVIDTPMRTMSAPDTRDKNPKTFDILVFLKNYNRKTYKGAHLLQNVHLSYFSTPYPGNIDWHGLNVS
tara:strand:- start:351 stop:641 length:291 start_codon:yes stop_codon:yes gene_type:complete